MIAYHKEDADDYHAHPNDLYHPNGDRKGNAELEEELLEEPFLPKIKRHVARNSFVCELMAFLTSVMLLIKCLARLNVEIGVLDEKSPKHPLFWLSLALTGIWLIVETMYIDSMEVLASNCGHYQRTSETTSS